MIAENRYIAKTLYGVEEDEDAPQPNTTIEEPKVLGVISGSNEKVCYPSLVVRYHELVKLVLFGLQNVVYNWH